MVDVRRLRDCAHGLGHRVPGDTPAELIDPFAGDLLPGWYDEWLTAPRERWHGVRLRALEILAERLLSEERHFLATEAAVAAIQLEPFRESSRRALIRTHLAEGNRAQAARELERFRVLLRDELGVAPSPELVALVACDAKTAAFRPTVESAR